MQIYNNKLNCRRNLQIKINMHPPSYLSLTSGMQSKEDIDGMIGNNFLKRFNMVIDFKDNKIYLQPNNFYYVPFYDFLIK